MGNGFQFIDIIFFALIAAFLILRLRSVLGRRDGHEGGHRDPFAHRQDRTRVEDKVVRLPDRTEEVPEGYVTASAEPARPPETPLEAGFTQIKVADPRFDPQEFTSGARIAFEMILSAFAAGDAATLKTLLNDEVYRNFAQSIREREEAGETMENTLVGVSTTEPVEAYMEGSVAHVTMKFVSEQINVVRDADGEVADGDPNAVAEVTDFWTFSRDTRARDPNWILVATRSLD